MLSIRLRSFHLAEAKTGRPAALQDFGHTGYRKSTCVSISLLRMPESSLRLIGAMPYNPFREWRVEIDNNKENATKRNRMQQFSIFSSLPSQRCHAPGQPPREQRIAPKKRQKSNPFVLSSLAPRARKLPCSHPQSLPHRADRGRYLTVGPRPPLMRKQPRHCHSERSAAESKNLKCPSR